jgi:hypothetical protein
LDLMTKSVIYFFLIDKITKLVRLIWSLDLMTKSVIYFFLIDKITKLVRHKPRAHPTFQ